MWSPQIVKVRFVEAAKTERFLPRPKVSTGAGFWPLHEYTGEDRAGWDEQAKADNADRWARDRKVTRAAISRHDECLDWSIRLLPGETHRRIVWAWAFAQANGWSFRESCRRRGWVPMTAYRRLSASFCRVSDQLAKVGALLRMPDENEELSDSESAAMNHGINTAPQNDSAISWTPGWIADDAILMDRPEIRDFSWSEEQISRRARKLLNFAKMRTASTTP